MSYDDFISMQSYALPCMFAAAGLAMSYYVFLFKMTSSCVASFQGSPEREMYTRGEPGIVSSPDPSPEKRKEPDYFQ